MSLANFNLLLTFTKCVLAVKINSCFCLKSLNGNDVNAIDHSTFNKKNTNFSINFNCF